ncbi:MAG TPA: hypothetical protein PLR92_03405 [Alicycliphilus denitrificans]|nr:hypothetical protein [Alicycliphilus denitrificans]
MTRVVLHIDRLVLRGVDPADAASFTAMLHAGLREHLATVTPEALAAAGNRLRLSSAPLPVAADADAGVLAGGAAAQIAAHIAGRPAGAPP